MTATNTRTPRDNDLGRPHYTATATFDGRAVRVIGLPDGLIGVTQGTTRDEAEVMVMARDVVSMLLEVPEDSFDLTITFD